MTQLPSFEEIVKFHGHLCPGIAIGYKISCVAVDWAGNEENIKVYSNSTRCPLDALQSVFHLREHPERLKVEDKNVLRFILEKPNGDKLYIDEVPGSKIRTDEYDILHEKVHTGIATKEEIERFDEIQNEYLHRIFETPNEKLFTAHT